MIKVTTIYKTLKLFNLNNIKKFQYSTQTSNKLYNLTSQSYLKLEGVDQISFLQGMTTNHIKNWFDKGEDKIIYTGILSPQGRVLFDAFLYRQEDDSLILETHKDNLSPLRSHILKYRLLSQVDVDDVTNNFTTLFSFGSEPLKLSGNGVVVKDPRVLEFGTRYLINNNSEQDLSLQSNELDYTLERYRLGIPEGPIEIRTNQALPMESNMELMNGVHFSKGCYVGQELTTRTKHRGVIRKRIVPITYDSSNGEVVPQDLYAPGSKRSVGKILSTLKGRGLALVKLTNINDTLITKSDDGNNTGFKCEVPNWWPSSIMENVEVQQ